MPSWPIIDEKYQILKLIGKGGFSEVYKVNFSKKAFDLNEMKEVAFKVHQLNQAWSEP